MANLFDPKDRRVLPNWRSYSLTVDLGELNDWHEESINRYSRNLSIDDYLLSWEQSKTIAIAGDLLSAAFVNGFAENPVVKDAALFVLSNQDKSTNTLINFAEKIINPPDDTIKRRVTFNNPEDCIQPNSLGNLIREIKNRLKQYPLNPILYVELSRLYSILGHKEKALQNMSIALQLAPEDRFVLRAASRLYVHFDSIDYIYHLIKNSDVVQHDPWITSTEIALATIMKRSPHLIKKGLQMIKSGKYSPFSLTELAASIGTLEFFNGNRKKTRNFLKKALISPNDNSLAQVEWILNKTHLFEMNPSDYKIENKYEALVLNDYYNGQWNAGLKNSVAWFCDLPFSKQPVIFGSHIAGDILEKSDVARKLLYAGLISHPNDAQIINNLVYSLALENKLNEAEKYMGRIRNWSTIDPIAQICLTATSGLISFRRGLQDQGRYQYLKAIEATKVLKNKHFQWLAELNYAREEILSKSDHIDSIMNAVKKIPEKTEYPHINKLRNDVLILYSKAKK